MSLTFTSRILRTLAGILLTSWAFAGGPYWTYIGIYLIVTAAIGKSPQFQMPNLKSMSVSQDDSPESSDSP